MIAIYFLIIIVFALYATKSLKKSFLAFSALSLAMNAAMAIRYSPPAVSIQLVLCLYYAVCFYIKRRNYVVGGKCFFKKSFVFVSISLFASSLVALSSGGLNGVTTTVMKIFTVYLFVYLFWTQCKSKEDIRFFTKILVVLFTIAYAYGLYEYFTQTNPILSGIMENMPEKYAKDKLYLSDLESLRDGRFRCQSIFSISILYGIFSVLFLFYILGIRNYNIGKYLKKWEMLLLIAMSLFGCYVCNSKTPLVTFPILIMPYVLRNKVLLLLDVILVIVFLIDPSILLNPIGEVINLEAFDAKNDDMTQGSNLYMRLTQLALSLDLWSQAPILGNGLRSAAAFSETSKYSMVLGAESVWFRLMIEQGALGLLSYIYMIYAFLKASMNTIHKSFFVCFTLGFFLICSITDINYTMYFMCFIALYRMDEIHRAEASKVG